MNSRLSAATAGAFDATEQQSEIFNAPQTFSDLLIANANSITLDEKSIRNIFAQSMSADQQKLCDIFAQNDMTLHAGVENAGLSRSQIAQVANQTGQSFDDIENAATSMVNTLEHELAAYMPDYENISYTPEGMQ